MMFTTLTVPLSYGCTHTISQIVADGPSKQSRMRTRASTTLSCTKSSAFHPVIVCFDFEAMANVEERMDACLCVKSARDGLGDNIVLRILRLRRVDHSGLREPMLGRTEATAAPRYPPHRPRVGRPAASRGHSRGRLSLFFVHGFESFSPI